MGITRQRHHKNKTQISGKFRRTVLDTHAFRGLMCKSDHHVVIAKNQV